MNIKKTFLFYDYETFGVHTSLDKISQFACIRTDFQFNIIGDPVLLYCYPPIDYLPNPDSVLITGITPLDIPHDHGMIESDFSKKIYDIFNKPNTCILGYNNITFDDEFTRNLFYRNFIDPYECFWKNNNSKWDVINILRACYVLSPSGFNWPVNDLGMPIFRLSDFSKLNDIEHVHVHNAMSDVYATVSVLEILKIKKPNLFSFLYFYRKKKRVLNFINNMFSKPLLYISNIFGSKNNNVSIVIPILWHPINSNILVVLDLMKNIGLLLNILHNTMYRYNTTLSQLFTCGIVFVHINKCPVLINESYLTKDNANRLSICQSVYLNNLKIFHKYIFFIKKKITEYFLVNKLLMDSNNVDMQLYKNFFTYKDQSLIKIIRCCTPQALSRNTYNFKDIRLHELLFRFRARNYFCTLNAHEKILWNQYCRSVVTYDRFDQYKKNIQFLLIKYKFNIKKIFLLRKLWLYIQYVMSNIY
ncbi:MAG: exodeoxyribonuclease I [Buchnera aphidicola (Eriosoma harunire)]